MLKFTALFIITAIICTTNSARILGIFHMPSYSHHILGEKIFKELASRGHEVTVITPYLQKTPTKNLKTVHLSGFSEQAQAITANVFEDIETMNIITKILLMNSLGTMFTETVLNHTNVQNLLKSNKKFDIIIIEQFLNEALKGFCYYYNAHCIMMSTVGPSRWSNPQMGNPGPPSYVPDINLSLSSNMNFCERVYNSFVYLLAELFSHIYTFRVHNEILHKYFPTAPHLYDLHYNTSLMLLNSHVSTNPAVPLVPNMISIGGYHVDPPKQLPKDLQDYLDNAKDGVIFFSMGSNIKSTNFPKEKLDVILNVFSKLKQKVLWKWEDDNLPGQPVNVKLGKWLPQQDILAHPNVKLFITHGGLLSTIETIYHGVPVVGIPIFGDQEMNIANAEILGYGIGVPYRTLNEKLLSNAVNEILNNPKYRENAKRRSKVMHDEPMKPLEKAVFWIEYVIRHQGASHLRSAALNLTWYQYLLLDVVAVIAVTLLILLFIFCKIIKKVFCKKSENKINIEKKRK